MLRVVWERLRQKKRTNAYPRQDVVLPPKVRGLPKLDSTACPSCPGRACERACPTGALRLEEASSAPRVRIDLGACLFCHECSRACERGAISFTPSYAMATARREDLLFSGDELRLAGALEKRLLRVFGRSLKLRQVSAGGCNACEADTNVLGTVVFDLGRFGVQFVASPRHADGILVTGPVSKNMELALKKTYEAVPEPKLVIACGTCSISGGIYRGHAETLSGLCSLLKPDLYIPGCPPHPMSILDGLLRLLGRN